MAHALFPLPGLAGWTPYGTAGLGLVHGVFDARGADAYDRAQVDLALTAGVGLMHALSAHVGLRAEARYIRVFADPGEAYDHDFGFLRASFGVTVGF